MKLDRLLSIVILLLNKERASAPDMAERFGVTARTIYRDLEAIDRAGIPVVSQAGPGGGYGIDPGFSIERRALGPADLAAILSALKGVNAALGDRLLGSAMDKLKGMAPRGEAGFEERLVVDLYPWGKRDEERALAARAERAIAEGRVLRFSYASVGKEREERSVEPMTLVFKSYAWYLWGYCRQRKEFRLFKLSRMKDLRMSMERFTRRPGSYDGGIVAPPPETETIVLRFDPDRLERVQEWFPSEDIAREGDGSVLATMRVPPGDWIVDTLLGMGPSMEVVEPASLRAKLVLAAEKIAKRNNTEKP
jgi:predicted DNA-binding transcriptional regulator YafY